MVDGTARSRRTSPNPGMEVLLTTLFAAAAACAILYFSVLDASGSLDPLRYFTLVPVTLAAYRRRGLLPGQAMVI